MSAYYNEIDPYAAQWLRNLIAAGHIAPGYVDERSIEDVFPSDLRGFTQCHFFAGIGVWSHALRRAGWSDDRSVWTGSCPCQPFSQAGPGAGFDDERHLWPAFFHLIRECKPAVVLGEQVASRDADPWIDLVQDDVEGVGYRFGAVPFPSAGVGAPHIRDRLYWVANASGSGRQWRKGAAIGGVANRPDAGRVQGADAVASASEASVVGLADHDQHGCGPLSLDRGDHTEHHVEPCGQLVGLGHADFERARRNGRAVPGQVQRQDGEHLPGDACPPGANSRMADTRHDHDAGQVQAARARQPQAIGSTDQLGGRGAPPSAWTGPVHGFWSAADWLLCRDGRWRPVEPGTFPLVDGAAARLGQRGADWRAPAGPQGFGHRAGRLKGYGNAINAEAARVFIECVMEDLKA